MHKPFLLMFSAVAILGGCGEGGDGATAAATAVDGVTDTEILLGTHNDLSGPAAVAGTGSVNGARMRFEEVNEAGGIYGRKIRYIVEDTGYQVPRAIQAANKLINRDKIFAMLAGIGTPMNNAVMPRLFEAGIPNLFPISGARSMIEPFNRLQFTGRGIYYDEIRAGTRYFLEEKGATTPCVIYQDTDYGQEILDGARDQLASMGLEAAAISAHKPTDSEFTAAILRLRNADCDLVLMGTIHRDTILIIETAQKMGFDDVHWVGTNASYTRPVAELESGAAEGYSAFVHIATLYVDDTNSEAVTAWLDKYVDKYGIEPEYSAQEGYRNADIVVQGLLNAGPDLTREKLVTGIEAIGEYEDMFGYRLTFGPDDHKGVDESILSVVEGGRWRTKAEKISY